jgi:hypothetical protein
LHALSWRCPVSDIIQHSFSLILLNQIFLCLDQPIKSTKRVTDVTTCPADFDLIDGACYQLTSSGLSWIDAELFAAQQSAHLASFSSAADHQAVFDYYNSLGRLTGDVWIGLNDIAVEGSFQWSDGNTSALRLFASGQPDSSTDGYASENCAYVHRADFLWYDGYCSGPSGTLLALLKWSSAPTPFAPGKVI